MHITDPIADMLTRIRNANSAKHDTVDVPASNMKKAIAQILLEKGEVLPVRPAEVLVHAQDGFEVAALARVSRLTSVGTRCESSVFDTEDEAIAYARSKGIPRVDLVGEAVRTVAL